MDKLNKDLKEAVEWIMKQPNYKEDEFTEMVKSIIKQDSFSKKQKDVLLKHIMKHQNNL